jgi:hypothetical protein
MLMLATVLTADIARLALAIAAAEAPASMKHIVLQSHNMEDSLAQHGPFVGLETLVA